MIDVQIVAGKYPELFMESLTRVLMSDSIIKHVYVANNTGQQLNVDHDKVTVLENKRSYTFEENHNRLAELGSSEYILFLDDDAFVFPGSVDMMIEVIKADPGILLVGGVNNQTWQYTGKEDVPKVGSLRYFLENENDLMEIAHTQREKFGSQTDIRLFCPGNLMLTRRDVWQKQYGGWDETYRNWNEEIDYIFWGYERGLQTVVLPGVWFFHCMSSSRLRSQLLDNIVESSCHLLKKFTDKRITAINKNLETRNKQLIAQLAHFLEFNQNCKNHNFVVSSSYYTKILPHLSDLNH